ncbi:MAG: EAL and HDOD domain-containing protein [Terriglobales bacterium]
MRATDSRLGPFTHALRARLWRFKLSPKYADVLTVSARKTSPPPAGKLAASGFSYVARQPILTVDEKVYGYELLFRDGIENHFRETDADSASRRTLDTSLQMGLDLLCDSRRGFINCTREILLKDYMTLLPPRLAVVEVLESVPVDDLVIAALKRLKQAGYLVSLDDFVINDPREPLTEFADIIKVDIKQTAPEHYAAMLTKYG